MGQVTISFLGVCTIFRDLPSLPPPPGLPPDLQVPMNRVVLARTTHEFLEQNPTVFPHIARLQLVADNVTFAPHEPPHKDPNAPFTYDLHGVQLFVSNATGPVATLTGNLDCLPGMKDHLDGPLGSPAPWVYLQDPGRVRAWFDMTNGEAAAFLMKTEQKHCDLLTQVPGITVVTIATDNDAEQPVTLEYVPFDGGPSITISLHGDSPNVNVMNFARGEAFVDDNRDYLLNYQLVDPIPPNEAVTIPQTNVCMTLSPMTYEVKHPHRCGDAGPGCSTTPFP